MRIRSCCLAVLCGAALAACGGPIAPALPLSEAIQSNASSGLSSAPAGSSQATLFAANQDHTLTVYVPPYRNAPTTVRDGIEGPTAMVVNAAGQLFVSNDDHCSCSKFISIFDPPYTALTAKNSTGLAGPMDITIAERNQALVVLDENGSSQRFLKYRAPYTGSPSSSIDPGVSDVRAVLVNRAATYLFPVGPLGDRAAFKLVSPFTGPPVAIAAGVPEPYEMRFDGMKDLFVSGSDRIYIYRPQFASPAIVKIMRLRYLMAVSQSGSLYAFAVHAHQAPWLVRYDPPWTHATLITKTPPMIHSPRSIAADNAGDVFLADVHRRLIYVYEAPYNHGPVIVKDPRGPEVIGSTP